MVLFAGDIVDKVLFRRFFLVDNVGNIPAAGGKSVPLGINIV